MPAGEIQELKGTIQALSNLKDSSQTLFWFGVKF